MTRTISTAARRIHNTRPLPPTTSSFKNMRSVANAPRTMTGVAYTLGNASGKRAVKAVIPRRTASNATPRTPPCRRACNCCASGGSTTRPRHGLHQREHGHSPTNASGALIFALRCWRQEVNRVSYCLHPRHADALHSSWGCVGARSVLPPPRMNLPFRFESAARIFSAAQCSGPYRVSGHSITTSSLEDDAVPAHSVKVAASFRTANYAFLFHKRGWLRSFC